jgi:hypothetical protein
MHGATAVPSAVLHYAISCFRSGTGSPEETIASILFAQCCNIFLRVSSNASGPQRLSAIMERADAEYVNKAGRPHEERDRERPPPSLTARPCLCHGSRKQKRSYVMPPRRILTQELAKDVACLPNRHSFGAAVVADYHREVCSRSPVSLHRLAKQLEVIHRHIMRIGNASRIHRD